MLSKIPIGAYTMTCLNEINKAKAVINSADLLIVGVGSGLSAAGGLNYADPKLTEKWYPEHFAMGLRSIIDIMANCWSNTVSHQPERFWGFWIKHIVDRKNQTHNE